jgi:hypothetical protein
VTLHATTFESLHGDVPTWLFCTHGLSKLGHPDLVLGVAARRSEDKADLLPSLDGFFRALLAYAEQGVKVSVGGRSCITPNGDGLLRRQDFRAVIYTHLAFGRADHPFAPDVLQAVVLTADEFAVAERFGHTRVLAKLGHDVRFYPTPAWIDRDRASVLMIQDMEQSLLKSVNTLSAYDSSVTCLLTGAATRIRIDMQVPFEETFPEITLGPETVEGIRSTLELHAGLEHLALLTSVPPEVSRCFVWNADGGAFVIGDARSEEARCACNFSMLVSGQERTCSELVEDGFATLLTKSDWDRVLEALRTGRSLEVKGPDDHVALRVHGLETS